MLNGQTLVAAKDNVTRIGTGCRFASCSDDQTNFDYHHKGWRLNLTGRY